MVSVVWGVGRLRGRGPAGWAAAAYVVCVEASRIRQLTCAGFWSRPIRPMRTFRSRDFPWAPYCGVVAIWQQPSQKSEAWTGGRAQHGESTRRRRLSGVDTAIRDARRVVGPQDGSQTYSSWRRPQSGSASARRQGGCGSPCMAGATARSQAWTGPPPTTNPYRAASTRLPSACGCPTPRTRSDPPLRQARVII